MDKKRFWHYGLLILLLTAAFFFRSSPQWVDRFYVQGMYPYLSRFLRWVFGGLPFSMGDLFYAFVLVLLIFQGLRFLRRVKKPVRLSYFITWKPLLNVVAVLGWLWLIFQMLWGFNYDRTGVAEQFGLSDIRPDSSMVRAFASFSLGEVNRFAHVRKQKDTSIDFRSQAVSAYHQLSLGFHDLVYQNVSFKPSSFGVLGNYMGYGGYYNPFSGEAHINDRLPDFLLPFVAVHEVAHQLGYAKESEANFIGYLAAMHSKDSALLYSAHFELFLHANAVLKRFDTAAARLNFTQLSPYAKSDLEAYRQFSAEYQGWIDDLTSWLYAHFLRLNKQPEGLGSYNRGMTYAMMYWYKKTGHGRFFKWN